LSYSDHSFLPIDYGHAEDTLGKVSVFIFAHFMVHPRGHVADIKNLGKRKEKMTLYGSAITKQNCANERYCGM
jgi:hypothetical protein